MIVSDVSLRSMGCVVNRAALVLLVALILGPGCGGSDSADSSGSTCKGGNDCPSGVCLNGTCVALKTDAADTGTAPQDSAVADAAPQDAVANDASSGDLPGLSDADDLTAPNDAGDLLSDGDPTPDATLDQQSPGCGGDAHVEGDACAGNSKEVDCASNGFNATDHKVDVPSKVVITYSDGQWSTPQTCDWQCDTDYAQEGEACLHTKQVICSVSPNMPVDAIPLKKEVTITYSSVHGWTPVASCLWAFGGFGYGDFSATYKGWRLMTLADFDDPVVKLNFVTSYDRFKGLLNLNGPFAVDHKPSNCSFCYGETKLTWLHDIANNDSKPLGAYFGGSSCFNDNSSVQFVQFKRSVVGALPFEQLTTGFFTDYKFEEFPGYASCTASNHNPGFFMRPNQGQLFIGGKSCQAIVDGGESQSSTVYYLEGDGPATPRIVYCRMSKTPIAYEFAIGRADTKYLGWTPLDFDLLKLLQQYFAAVYTIGGGLPNLEAKTSWTPVDCSLLLKGTVAYVQLNLAGEKVVPADPGAPGSDLCGVDLQNFATLQFIDGIKKYGVPPLPATWIVDVGSVGGTVDVPKGNPLFLVREGK